MSGTSWPSTVRSGSATCHSSYPPSERRRFAISDPCPQLGSPSSTTGFKSRTWHHSGDRDRRTRATNASYPALLRQTQPWPDALQLPKELLALLGVLVVRDESRFVRVAQISQTFGDPARKRLDWRR